MMTEKMPQFGDGGPKPEVYRDIINITVGEELTFGNGKINAPTMAAELVCDKAEAVGKYLVTILPPFYTVCIDGRPRAEYENELPLGPHIAGGAETALVAAASVGYAKQGGELITFLETKRHHLRAHVDSGDHGGGTGCGACDKCEDSCKSFNVGPKIDSSIQKTVKVLMGDDFRQDIFNELELKQGEDRAHDCVPENETETLFADPSLPNHGHTELFIVLNYIQNTTIDRDSYAKETGDKVFIIDMWHLKQLADDMASGDEAMKSRLYHAMVAFQVATYHSLGDGSHRPVSFKP